jgi:hypothetical protein
MPPIPLVGFESSPKLKLQSHTKGYIFSKTRTNYNLVHTKLGSTHKPNPIKNNKKQNKINEYINKNLASS